MEISKTPPAVTRFLASLRPADKYLVWVILGLAAFGIVAVYSAVGFLAATKSGGDTERFLLRHLSRVVIALGVMGVVSLIDYRKLARLSKLALVFSIGLLIAVQVIGTVQGGARRWLEVGAFGFQPSDLAKVALVLYVAVMLARKQEYIKDFSRSFLPILVWIMATVVLIGIEDLSSAVLLLVATLTMCFVARISTLHITGTALLGLVLAAGLLLASPHRAARVEAFLGLKIFPNTTSEQVFDAQDEGYQAQQARIAFAMGGLTGVGPGKSVQRDFLPAPYNDFIFAIIAEEYGIIGALALLALFVVFLARGLLRVARHAADPLGLFVAVGMATMLALYGFIHAGVASGLLPVTGLPMPFVSYGGTSMLAAGLMVGILLNISRQIDDKAIQQDA
jgi:cell division protein FtsW